MKEQLIKSSIYFEPDIYVKLQDLLSDRKKEKTLKGLKRDDQPNSTLVSVIHEALELLFEKETKRTKRKS